MFENQTELEGWDWQCYKYLSNITI